MERQPQQTFESEELLQQNQQPLNQQSSASHFQLIDRQCLTPMVSLQEIFYIDQFNQLLLKMSEENYHRLESMYQKVETTDPKDDNKMPLSEAQSQTQAQIVKEIQKIAEENLSVLNNVLSQHKNGLKVMEILFSSSVQGFNLNKLQYDVESLEEIGMVVQRCRMACQYDMGAFYFFTTYMERCARNLWLRCKNFTQVERRVKKIFQDIKQLYPQAKQVVGGGVQGDFLSKVKSFFTGTEQGHSEVDNDIRSFKDKQSLMVYGSLDLSPITPEDRNRVVEECIFEVSEKAQKNIQEFISIVRDVCIENHGEQFKAEVRQVNENSNLSEISYLKSKLVQEQFKKPIFEEENQFLPPSNDFQFILKREEEIYHRQVQQILKTKSTPLDMGAIFGDILSATCQFREAFNLKAAVKQILKRSNKKNQQEKSQNQGQKVPFNYKVIEIDNRLYGKQAEIVMKIEMDKCVVGSLRLVYRASMVDNEFYSQIDRLGSSKFLTSVGMLRWVNENSNSGSGCGDGLRKFYRVLEGLSKKEAVDFLEELKQSRLGSSLILDSGDVANVQRLIGDLEEWFERCEIKVSNGRFDEKEKQAKYYSFASSQKVKNQNNIRSNSKHFFLSSKYSLSFKNYSQASKYIQEYSKQIGPEGKDSEKLSIIKTKCQIAALTTEHYEQNFIELFTECLRLDEKVYGRESDEYYCTLKNLAIVQHNRGEYLRALENFEESLKIKKVIKKEDVKKNSNPKLACVKILNFMGVCYLALCDYGKAIEMHRQAFEMIMDAQSEGEQGTNTVKTDTMNYMGDAYYKMHKNNSDEKAFEWHSRALELIAKSKGKDSLSYAESLIKIGLYYKEKDQLEKSLQYYSQSLQIFYRVQGKGSLKYAQTLCNMGSIYLKKHNLEKALELNLEALSLIQNLKGRGSNITIHLSHIYNMIGSIYFKKGQFSRSLENYEKCQEIRRQIHGKLSSEYVLTLVNISAIQKARREFQEAKNTLNEALEILKTFPDFQRHHSYERVRNELAKVECLMR